MDAGGAFAAYITGNVASNLIGRLVSAAIADGLVLSWNFYLFATLNLAGAVLVYFTIRRVRPMHATMPTASPLEAMVAHWRNPQLRAAYGIGFCILLAFIGTFTFVNFVLVRPPLSLGMMDLGFVYVVFLPSVVTTLLAGKAVARIGTRATLWVALGVAGLGLPLMLSARPHESPTISAFGRSGLQRSRSPLGLGLVSTLARAPQIPRWRQPRWIGHLHAGQHVDIAALSEKRRLPFTAVTDWCCIGRPNGIELLFRVILVAHAILERLTKIDARFLVCGQTILARLLDIDDRHPVCHRHHQRISSLTDKCN